MPKNLQFGPGRQFSRYEDRHKVLNELKLVEEVKVLASVLKLVELFHTCREPGCSEGKLFPVLNWGFLPIGLNAVSVSRLSLLRK